MHLYINNQINHKKKKEIVKNLQSDRWVCTLQGSVCQANAQDFSKGTYLKSLLYLCRSSTEPVAKWKCIRKKPQRISEPDKTMFNNYFLKAIIQNFSLNFTHATSTFIIKYLIKILQINAVNKNRRYSWNATAQKINHMKVLHLMITSIEL